MSKSISIVPIKTKKIQRVSVSKNSASQVKKENFEPIDYHDTYTAPIQSEEIKNFVEQFKKGLEKSRQTMETELNTYQQQLDHFMTTSTLWNANYGRVLTVDEYVHEKLKELNVEDFITYDENGNPIDRSLEIKKQIEVDAKNEYLSQLNQQFKEQYGITYEEHLEKMKRLENDLMVLKSSNYILNQQLKMLPYEDIFESDEFLQYKSRYHKTFNLNDYDLNSPVKVGTDPILVAETIEKEGKNLEHYPYLFFSSAIGSNLRYSVLTDDQKMMYHFLYDTKGMAEAEKYIKESEHFINVEVGTLEANEFLESIRNEDGNYQNVLNLLRTNKKGLGDGIDNYFDGIKLIFDNEGIMTVNQVAQSKILEALQNKKGYTTSYEMGMNMGNMIPPIAVSLFTTGLYTGDIFFKGANAMGSRAGYIASGLSVFGNSKNNALVKGNSLFSSSVYGAITGLSEVGLGSLLGNIGFLNENASFAVEKILNEGIEECIQEYLDAGFQAALLNEPIEISELQGASLKSFFYGVLLSSVTTGAQAGVEVLYQGVPVQLTNYQVLELYKTLDSGLDNHTIVQNYFDKDSSVSNRTEVILNEYQTLMSDATLKQYIDLKNKGVNFEVPPEYASQYSRLVYLENLLSSSKTSSLSYSTDGLTMKLQHDVEQFDLKQFFREDMDGGILFITPDGKMYGAICNDNGHGQHGEKLDEFYRSIYGKESSPSNENYLKIDNACLETGNVILQLVSEDDLGSIIHYPHQISQKQYNALQNISKDIQSLASDGFSPRLKFYRDAVDVDMHGEAEVIDQGSLDANLSFAKSIVSDSQNNFSMKPIESTAQKTKKNFFSFFQKKEVEILDVDLETNQEYLVDLDNKVKLQSDANAYQLFRNTMVEMAKTTKDPKVKSILQNVYKLPLQVKELSFYDSVVEEKGSNVQVDYKGNLVLSVDPIAIHTDQTWAISHELGHVVDNTLLGNRFGKMVKEAKNNAMTVNKSKMDAYIKQSNNSLYVTKNKYQNQANALKTTIYKDLMTKFSNLDSYDLQKYASHNQLTVPTPQNLALFESNIQTQYYLNSFAESELNATAAASDILSAVMSGEGNFPYGHDTQYYAADAQRYSEMFANYFQLKAMNNTHEIQILRDILGESWYNYMENRLSDVAVSLERMK